MALEEGQKAPSFTLPINGDSTASLSDYQGRKVVLFIYPKDDTSGCTKEAIAFSEHKEPFSKLGVDILGLSKDSVKSHDKFIAKYDLTVTLLSDEACETLDDYGVWIEKSMYGKKYMGAERTTFIIDENGMISKIYRKVKVPGHVETVLKDIQAML